MRADVLFGEGEFGGQFVDFSGGGFERFEASAEAACENRGEIVVETAS